MKEALFILLVIGVLAALTAIRYRKQIAGVIGIAKMLKETTRAATDRSRIGARDEKSVPLVNCSKCGVWVPQNKAVKIRGIYYCSDSCLASAAN